MSKFRSSWYSNENEKNLKPVVLACLVPTLADQWRLLSIRYMKVTQYVGDNLEQKGENWQVTLSLENMKTRLNYIMKVVKFCSCYTLYTFVCVCVWGGYACLLINIIIIIYIINTHTHTYISFYCDNVPHIQKKKNIINIPTPTNVCLSVYLYMKS